MYVFSEKQWVGIESCWNLVFKRYKLQVDLLQHQDESLSTEQSEVTMVEELISCGRAMDCRSFSTTPPSPLFRAAADFSSHGIHMSHSGHISGEGVLLKNCRCHCKINYLLQFEREARTTILSVPQTKYQ